MPTASCRTIFIGCHVQPSITLSRPWGLMATFTNFIICIFLFDSLEMLSVYDTDIITVS